MTAFPANPYVCLKPGEHDVTLMSFMADVSNVASLPFVKMCPIDCLEGLENFGDDLYVTSGDIAGKREGGQKIAPPPLSGAG